MPKYEDYLPFPLSHIDNDNNETNSSFSTKIFLSDHPRFVGTTLHSTGVRGDLLTQLCSISPLGLDDTTLKYPVFRRVPPNCSGLEAKSEGRPIYSPTPGASCAHPLSASLTPARVVLGCERNRNP